MARVVLKDENGKEINALEPVFPILTGNPETKTFECAGTGFLLSRDGLFVTARHVIEDKQRNLLRPLFAIQTIDGKHYTRYRKCIVRHPDIALWLFQ